LLFGEASFQKLKNSHILIVGLGGVGGYAAEQICRAGVGKLSLIDSDTIQESNINRQLIASTTTIGKNKTDVFLQRLKDINPDAEIFIITDYISESNVGAILNTIKPDYVVDAIDTPAPKVSLIKTCIINKIPIVSSMGAGGRINPEKVQIADIEQTYNCGLARVVRKRLHKMGIRGGFKVVFSSENVIEEAIVQEESRNKKTNVGSVSYMPAVFGMFLASVVIRDITNNK
jgi:tRNA A37 threonylcarbamoyladenosine dehydratase